MSPSLHSVPLHDQRATVALNWLARRCDSQWQEAGAHWASLWTDHINYAKQQLKQEEGGAESCIVSLRSKRTGRWRSQITACSQPRRPHETSRAQVEFLKNRVWGQKHYHESDEGERCGTFQLVSWKKQHVNNVFLLDLHTEAAEGETGRQAEIFLYEGGFTLW